MAKSKIIKNLVNDEVDIDQSLYRLLIIANDLDDVELIQWVENELNGYNSLDDVPKYRVISGIDIKYSGINGNFQVTNQPMSLFSFPKEHRNDLREYKMIESIKTISDIVKSGEKLSRDLTFFAGDIAKSTGIKCFSITGYCNMIAIGDLVSIVKTKTLKVLMRLEKEFGLLDDLDIEIDERTDVDKIKADINLIIYDNSISIGNDNDIKDSKFLVGSDDSGD